MKLVHLADLHLGYRAYHRSNSRGINVREADVGRAFRQALERIVQLDPDLVLIAGDLFHSVRPSNSAIADAFRQLSRFCESLDAPRVVIIAGDHDSPRSVETGSILRLFGEIDGILVVNHEPKRLRFRELDASVLCLPHNALIARLPAIEPDPDVAHNILLAHAIHPEIDDDDHRLLMGFGGASLPGASFDPEGWDYVALGHYHRFKVFRKPRPNMAYAGAIERTSLNIWEERDDEKGFVVFDTDDDEPPHHHALEDLREIVDIGDIQGSGLTVEAADEAIESAVAHVPGGIEGKIVRLRIWDLPREVYRGLDHRRIREYRARALHFHLDVRAPRIVRREGSAAPGRRLTLEEELVQFLKHGWSPASKETDKESLIELGVKYLKEAEEAEIAEGA